MGKTKEMKEMIKICRGNEAFVCTNSNIMGDVSDCIECRTCTRNPDCKPMKVGDHYEQSETPTRR